MENDKNYFLVGIFVLLLMVAGLGFTLWLTSAGKGEYVYYRVRFDESVGGLNKESTVKYRGVEVGNVKTIEIDPDDMRLVRVDLRVLKGTPIKPSTIASLKNKGITGDIYVDLDGGAPEEQTVEGSKDAENPPEIKAGPSLITLILERAASLLEKANTIADHLGKLFSDKNVKTVSTVVHKVGKHFGADDDEQKDQKEQQDQKSAAEPVRDRRD